MITIRVRENGPLVVSDSAVEIIAPDGTLLSADKSPVALCRCGHSKIKPFCDGAHHQKGFKPDTHSDT
jgi:CDGSH-type Zn-finger protein